MQTIFTQIAFKLNPEPSATESDHRVHRDGTCDASK